MAWGSDTAATQLTGITTEQFYQVPTLNPREAAHVQVSVDFAAPGALAAGGAVEQEGGGPPPLAGAGSVVCLMG